MAAECILVVEDEPDLIRSLEYNLQRNGLAPLIATSVWAAEQFLAADPPPDLVLLDLMLPDDSGLELCRRMRSNPRTWCIPVIMVTARGAEPDRLEGFDAGADDYVTKPFSTRELMKRIRAQLRRNSRRPAGPEPDSQIGLPATLRRMLGQIRPRNGSTEESVSHGQVIRAALSLARAVDARDPHTHRHSEKVAAYAMALGRHLGLGTGELGELRIGGLLHDLGKIGVADTVLLKPTRLADDELEAVRRHPRIGATIIEPIGFSTNIRSIVTCHHEHFDGSGYPEGLAGDHIPRLAQIVHLVDAYDAMSADRVYRRALRPAWIRSDLERLRGHWYSPELVDALFELMDSGRLGDLNRRLRVAEQPIDSLPEPSARSA